jgi:Transcription factor WhiB
MMSSALLREEPSPPKAATRCPEAADLSVGQLNAIVTSPLAGCFGSTNPDDWFPVATRADRARAEAASALRLCVACPVRAHCLELSMRVWHAGGKHGIWGGLMSTDRVRAHRQWLTGTPVEELLEIRLRRYRNANAAQAEASGPACFPAVSSAAIRASCTRELIPSFQKTCRR